MDKTRVNLTLDPDVLAFIDSLAAKARLERSAFVNQYFLHMMPAATTNPGGAETAGKPAARRKRA